MQENSMQAKSEETKFRVPPSTGQRNHRAVKASKRPQVDAKQPSKGASKLKEDQVEIIKKLPSNLPQNECRSPDSSKENSQNISVKRKYPMKVHETACRKDT